MNTCRKCLLRIALIMAIVLAVPLLVYASYIAERSPATGIRPVPDAWVEIGGSSEQLEQSLMSVSEVIEQGKQGYQRSCVGCHGLSTPAALPHHDAQRFVEIVRNGDNTMPALGFKLNSVEIEMIRIYLQHCAADGGIC
jgi:mono/diheme cytochrome c family protein